MSYVGHKLEKNGIKGGIKSGWALAYFLQIINYFFFAILDHWVIAIAFIKISKIKNTNICKKHKNYLVIIIAFFVVLTWFKLLE